MHRVADRGREHLGLDLLLPVRGDDVGHDAHAVLVDVVEPAGERTHDVRADGGREQGLIHREAQRDVDADALAREHLRRAQTVGRERDLHDDVLVPRGDAAPFHDHVVALFTDALGGHVADESADALDLCLVVLSGLRDEGRIRRDAVDDAPLDRRLDLVVLGRVEEELHRRVSCSIGADASARPFARAKASAESMKLANSGCGRLGRDLNSGWNCVPR